MPRFQREDAGQGAESTGARHETSMRGNKDLLVGAEGAATANKAGTLRETVAVYKKGILWSILLSTALVMEGYDVNIVNSFFGQNSFLHRFGTYNPATGTYYVPANWQAAVNNAASIGEVIGLIINGYCQPRFGSKKTYLCAMAGMAAAIFIPVFSTSLKMLFAGELVCGIPWGVFQTLTTAYAAEICPIALRGYLTSYVNCCWGFGLTLGAAVVRASLPIEGNWGWRMPYAVQWIWPIPLFCAALFAPESPWWLVKNGREADAEKALRRLTRSDYWTDETIKGELTYMVHTIEMERAETEGTSWRDLFRGTNRRRTEIICVVWSCQYWCGQPITSFATEFLQTAGLSQDGAFDINIAVVMVIFIGSFISWAFLYRYGRRFLYILGLSLMAILFLIMGILGCLPNTVANSTGIGTIMILVSFAFGISVAPVCYTIVAEIPATRVRAQSVVLARTCYIFSQAALQQLFPRFLTAKPGGWGIGGKAGFIFVGVNLLLVFYCWARLPETIGRTFGEINVLFENNVPARRFKHTTVDEFQADRILPQEVVDYGKSGEVVHNEKR